MKNYKIQDGCYNCKKVFKKIEYEDELEYFCTHNAPKRPLCLSVFMDEYPSYDVSLPKKYHDKLIKNWDSWFKVRQVDAWGICDLYKGGGN